MLFAVLILGYSFAPYLDSSLAFIGLTRDDLAFRNDYSARDVYRFAVIDSLLLDPIGSIDFVLNTERNFWAGSTTDMLGSLTKLYGFVPEPRAGSFRARFDECFSMIQNAVDQNDSVLGSVLQALIEFSPEPTGSIEEEKEYERQSDSLVDYLGEHAARIGYETIFEAALILLKALDDLDLTESGLPVARPVDGAAYSAPGVRRVTGQVLHYEEFRFGAMVIGDSGDNTYTGEFAIILDLGGDDTYRSTQNQYLHVIVDQAGNDEYVGEDYSVACGNFGVSVLIDNAGDDTYEAGNFSLGSGVFGIGILIDRAGNDDYSGDTFTQGAAGFGIGILSDRAGNDTYAGALYAQGFATTYGIGVLADALGNDQYLIRQKYLDEIRYLDHYLAMSQGFTIGFRPDLSAGIGLLLDGGGNDQYVADIFGQGAGYWYGIGAIVDKAGNDNYVAYQYAQGSGVHVALGLLIDEAGDDNYVAKGVSQGCGHDLSLGLLFDRRGSDTYAAFDLSQGAGNANGIGLLIDEFGDDAYTVKKQHNTQGYGDFRREYGSIGVLLDISGADDYTSGGDSQFWEKGRYGIGVDWP
ncbi:MAG: hypothetical protein PVH23_01865 [candidate division WOR-3 bacterium]